MRHVRVIIVMLLVAIALSAVAVSEAQAVTAPFWSIGGTRLAEGKTHAITGRVFRSFLLSAPEVGSD